MEARVLLHTRDERLFDIGNSSPVFVTKMINSGPPSLVLAADPGSSPPR